MNIALIGYGKMGQEIERQAKELHTIALKVDPLLQIQTPEDTDFSNIDVAIDFTHPSVILKNITLYCEKKVNVVIGTTGWTDHLEQVRGQVEQAGIGLLWGSNFSIGVHLFWEMVRRSGELMNHFNEYDVFGHEFHHNQKADAPSGTARSTAEILLNTLDRKTTLLTHSPDRKIAPHELEFSSTRGGAVPGTHSIYFDSAADTIELTHTARNRSGFAIGALRCAEWIQNKKGFFSIEDYIKEKLHS